MGLSISNITKLLKKASEKRSREDAWELYLTLLPNMGQENFMTFDEFYDKGKSAPEGGQSEEEILSDVKEILDSFNGGENDIGIFKLYGSILVSHG